MKKNISIFFILALFFCIANAQEIEDEFYIDLDADLTNLETEQQIESVSEKKSNIAQGLWLETTSITNAIIRDLATGEKSGYEIDNSHFMSNANWWFWGNVTPNIDLDAEIAVWNFDKPIYQANSYGANIPVVTVGDGLQSILAMPFSFLYNGNTDEIGALSKMGFTLRTPLVDIKLGSGNLQENGMSEFTGIYTVLDRWPNVGKGFTEIKNGKSFKKIGQTQIDVLVALSMMKGTYGFYDIVSANWNDTFKLAGTFASYTTEEELFYYNKENINAVSLYTFYAPIDVLSFELHALNSFGTSIENPANAYALAGRIQGNFNSFWFSVSESFAGSEVNSAFGVDGTSYDDINANTLTTQLLCAWDTNSIFFIELDELLSVHDTNDLSNGFINLRSQLNIDFDFASLIQKNMTIGLYGVYGLDRLDTATSQTQNVIPYFDEAGIQYTAYDFSFIKKLQFDYAYSVSYKSWEEGKSYKTDVLYNSCMLGADLTDTVSAHLGSLIRLKQEADASFVPFGIAAGLKINKIPILGNPLFWIHATYGMNPYSENNYSLYRADNSMNKNSHRTYLLNDVYENYTTSQIGFGLIWNIQ